VHCIAYPCIYTFLCIALHGSAYALLHAFQAPAEVCVCFYFSCNYSTWWEFDLVDIDSCQAAKPIIIPSKTLVKLTLETNL